MVPAVPAHGLVDDLALERFQVDMTWMVIRALEVVGLATNVKLPTERQKARLLIKKSQGGGAAPAAA